MRVLLESSAVSIDDQPLRPRMDAAAIAALVGAPVSSRDIPLYPAGIRKANVSASGIVWYVDYPEDRITHLHLAISPGDTPETPERPPSAFTGSIHLNGVDLSAELSEATFPGRGEVVVAGDHHSWSYETSAHHVAFVFRRRRNHLGRRSGVPRLSFVSISFRGGSEPGGPASGSQPFRSEANHVSKSLCHSTSDPRAIDRLVTTNWPPVRPPAKG